MAITAADRRAVVKFARDQVGQPYRWLGDGIQKPGFDCSGLVLMSWLQAGVTLPHQSGQQAALLKAVPYSWANKEKLQAGDVVFYYGDVAHPASISHCAIYVGPGVGYKRVVAAVDTAHGVMEHTMFWALTPSGFGYVEHD